MTATVETTEPITGSELVEASDNPTDGELDPGWQYERMEYKGDSLAFRFATMQALMAYQLSSGKFISMEKQNDASGLFIDMHLGPDTYDRILYRMSDPDDAGYDLKSFGEIMAELVKRSIAKIREDREAQAAAEKALKA
jgi:hypothetical protein